MPGISNTGGAEFGESYPISLLSFCAQTGPGTAIWTGETKHKERGKPSGWKKKALFTQWQAPAPAPPLHGLLLCPPLGSTGCFRRDLCAQKGPAWTRMQPAPGLSARSHRFYLKFDLMPSLDSPLLSII